MTKPISTWDGTIHVLRLPNLLMYKQSTSGAHSNLRLNGHDWRLNVPSEEKEAPRSFRIIGITRPRPIGMPCSVYSTCSAQSSQLTALGK